MPAVCFFELSRYCTVLLVKSVKNVNFNPILFELLMLPLLSANNSSPNQNQSTQSVVFPFVNSIFGTENCIDSASSLYRA
jgi:hypothetical protein